jgi:hypothetical protein
VPLGVDDNQQVSKRTPVYNLGLHAATWSSIVVDQHDMGVSRRHTSTSAHQDPAEQLAGLVSPFLTKNKLTMDCLMA